MKLAVAADTTNSCESPTLDVLQLIEMAQETARDEEEIVYRVFQNHGLSQEEAIRIFEIMEKTGLKTDIRKLILTKAIAMKKERILQYAIDSMKLDFDVSDIHGNSLAHAVVNFEGVIFQKQLTSITNVKTRCDDDVYFAEAEIERFLLWLEQQKRVDLLARNYDGKTVIDLALQYNLQHVTKLLGLKVTESYHRRYEEMYGESMLHPIVRGNQSCLDKYKHQEDVLLRYCRYAVRHTPTCVELLLETGANPLYHPVVYNNNNVDHKTPLYVALRCNDVRVAEMMLRLVDLQKQPELANSMLYEVAKTSPLWWGCPKSESLILYAKKALAVNANPNYQSLEDRCRPLYWALRAKNVDLVRLLLQNGASLRLPINSATGQSPLHALAAGINDHEPTLVNCEDQDQQIFDILFYRGSVIDSSNLQATNGQTPLHAALSDRNLLLTQLLIARGDAQRYVNVADYSGTYPIHLASCMQTTKFAELLLQVGAHVNCVDDLKRSPLFYAASRHDCLPIVKLLLSYGAQLITRRKCAFLEAINHRCHLNVQEMLEYGADLNAEGLLDSLRNLVNETSVLTKLLQHWTKLVEAGMPAHPRYERFKTYVPGLHQVALQCRNELAVIKKTSITNRVSLHQFLLSSIHQRMKLLRNDNGIHWHVNPLHLRKQFANYAGVILASYREATTRNALLRDATASVFEYLWNQYPIPDLCCDKIFTFLTNSDLQALIEASQL